MSETPVQPTAQPPKASMQRFVLETALYIAAGLFLCALSALQTASRRGIPLEHAYELTGMFLAAIVIASIGAVAWVAIKRDSKAGFRAFFWASLAEFALWRP
jgi:hypothetical protein